MAGSLRKRPEEEVLVESAGAAVDVAADEVDVHGGDVGGGERDPRERRTVEVARCVGRGAR